MLKNKIKKIAIIDYGMGNVGSIKNMFSKLDIWSEIIDNPNEIREKDAIILPGVGSYDSAVQKLKKLGFWNEIKKFVEKDNKPILGICLGMQLLFENSQEFGLTKGLGLIQGDILELNKKKTNNAKEHLDISMEKGIHKIIAVLRIP